MTSTDIAALYQSGAYPSNTYTLLITIAVFNEDNYSHFQQNVNKKITAGERISKKILSLIGNFTIANGKTQIVIFIKHDDIRIFSNRNATLCVKGAYLFCWINRGQIH